MRNDLSIYEKRSSEWWHSQGRAFRSLRKINEYRFQHISSVIPQINDKHILDIGCGGGLLSIPLLERGATVTGIDRSANSIAEAQKEARRRSLNNGNFITGDALNIPFSDNSYDVIILSDILEHVENVSAVLKEAVRCLRPHGWLYASTINKTWRSYILAILTAENLGYVPKGTHDWNMFITPETLIQLGTQHGLDHQFIFGERPKICASVLNNAITVCDSSSLAVSYSTFFTKERSFL